MKKLSLMLALFVLTVCASFAQVSNGPDQGTPLNAEAGKCYAKCLIEDQYETVTEEVLTRAASTRVDVVPATYETVTEELLTKEASTTLSVSPATFETVTEEILVKEASTQLSVTPATFETVTEEVLVREAGKAVSLTAAKFKTESEQVLVKENTNGLRAIPAKFETVTEEVLVKEAFKQLQVVPATFETVTEEKLVQEAYDVITVVPATYETITEEKLVKAAYSTMATYAPILDLDGLISAVESGSNSYTTASGAVRTFTNDEINAIRSLIGTGARLSKDSNGNVYATLTETVLEKDGYNTLRVIPATYETVTEEVLEKEAYSTLRVIPATYETVTEQVLAKEASTRIEKKPAEYTTETVTIVTAPASEKWVKKKADPSCLSANPDDCLVWCLVEVPEQTRTVTKRVKVGCEAGWTDNGDDCTRVIDIPAEYTTRTYQKLASAATTERNPVAAKYGTRTYQKLASAATTESSPVALKNGTRTYKKLIMPVATYRNDVPAQYTTRTYQKLASGPTTTVETVPARYETRTYQRVATPATVTEVEVPAQYTTRSYKKVAANAATEETPCSQSMTLDNINFQTGSAVLLQSSYAEISKLEAMLKADNGITAKLVGHTDSDGSEASNLTLSRNRAKAVYDVLVNSGISASRLSYEGKGESQPIATNATAAGKRKNRRTEFISYGGTTGGDCNEYGTRTYQVLDVDAADSYTDIAAEYGTRSFQRLVTDAAASSTDVPAQYSTRTYQKLSSDASANTTDVPAQYGNRSYQKLASAATVRTSDIPAEYKTISKRQLVKAGGFNEWREVVCADDITTNLVQRVQSALNSRGYDVGPADGVNGAKTKSALARFQKDNGLPVGNFNFETLRALGIK